MANVEITTRFNADQLHAELKAAGVRYSSLSQREDGTGTVDLFPAEGKYDPSEDAALAAQVVAAHVPQEKAADALKSPETDALLAKLESKSATQEEISEALSIALKALRG